MVFGINRPRQYVGPEIQKSNARPHQYDAVRRRGDRTDFDFRRDNACKNPYI
jgi:hypothetical protein